LLTADATFDLKTKIQVMEFQWQHRLKADGIVDKITAAPTKSLAPSPRRAPATPGAQRSLSILRIGEALLPRL
jgi:peptidoglycan hydrolase-like protein with peptidoglycan-binding domain